MSRMNEIYLRLCKGILEGQDRAYLLETAHSGVPDHDAWTFLSSIGLLREPGLVGFVEPYLHRSDRPDLAKEALITIRRLGCQERYKDHIIRAARLGFDWDAEAEVGISALFCIGEFLCRRHDPECAGVVRAWLTRTDDYPRRTQRENTMVGVAKVAAGIAVGYDPGVLVDDQALLQEGVRRFLAERTAG